MSFLAISTSILAVDFDREVAPILEAHCLSCHDANSLKGDVRPDDREHAFEFIAIGKPDESSLIEQISGPEPAMPKKGSSLSADQVRTLRDWIESGAAWPDNLVLKDNPPRNLDWWSLKPIQSTMGATLARCRTVCGDTWLRQR